MLKQFEFDYLENARVCALRLEKVRRESSLFPQGSLVELMGNDGKIRRYLSIYENGARRRTYLSPEKDGPLISLLARKQDQERGLSEELSFLAKFFRRERADIVKCLSHLEFIPHPAFPVSSSLNPKHREHLRHKTLHGELVRNKAERGWADGFLLFGIPYEYEQPLEVDAGEAVFPDFRFPHPLHGQISFLEHTGWDSEDYYRRLEWKKGFYRRVGLVPGRTLFFFNEEDAADTGARIREFFTPERYRTVVEALKSCVPRPELEATVRKVTGGEREAASASGVGKMPDPIEILENMVRIDFRDSNEPGPIGFLSGLRRPGGPAPGR